MSASMRPTRRPWRASAAARFTETLDLPTPPLPEETASTLPRCGSSTGVGGGGTAAPGASPGLAPAPRAGAPPPATVIFTPVTPATACTALRASRARVPGSSADSRKVNVTCPRSSTARSWTMPAVTTFCATRGFWTPERARVGGGHGRECTRAEAGGSTRAEAGSCPGQAVGCRLYAGYGSISQSNPLRWEYPGVKEVKER